MCAQQVIWIFYNNWPAGEQRVIAPFLVLTWAYHGCRKIMLLQGAQRTILVSGLWEFLCSLHRIHHDVTQQTDGMYYYLSEES
jgi:hypothetical protein